MAGERGLAHKELAMKEKEGEEDDGWWKQKISTSVAIVWCARQY
jgi:hypothetical protein